MRADLVSKGVRFGWITPIPTASSISTRSTASTPTLSCDPSAARACSPRSGSSPSTRSTSIMAWRRSNASACAGPAATILPEPASPTRSPTGDVSALVAFQSRRCRRRPSRRTCPATGDRGAEGGEAIPGDRLRFVPRQTLPLKSLVFTDPAPYDMAGTLRKSEAKAPIRIDLAGSPSPRRSKERQGRMADPALQRPQAPSHRRRDGQRARQRIAGAAFRRARRVPDAAALGRRLDRALWPQRRLSHARRDHRGAWGRGALFARRLSRALLRTSDSVVAFLRSLVIEAP